MQVRNGARRSKPRYQATIEVRPAYPVTVGDGVTVAVELDGDGGMSGDKATLAVGSLDHLPERIPGRVAQVEVNGQLVVEAVAVTDAEFVILHRRILFECHVVCDRLDEARVGGRRAMPHPFRRGRYCHRLHQPDCRTPCAFLTNAARSFPATRVSI